MSWQVLLYNGSSWIYNLPNPGEQEVAIESRSTLKEVTLADGSIAFVTPKVGKIKAPVSFKITQAQEPNTILNIEKFINDAIDAKYKLILKTHTGEEIVGKFSECRKIYHLSGKTQKYSLEIKFNRI